MESFATILTALDEMVVSDRTLASNKLPQLGSWGGGGGGGGGREASNCRLMNETMQHYNLAPITSR